VHPDLPVLERVEHVLGVVFIRKRRAVLRQTVRDFSLLFCGQKLRGRWVVVHAEKGNDRFPTSAWVIESSIIAVATALTDDKREQTFQDKDPGPAIEAS